MAESKAKTIWNGNLMQGGGTVSADSGIFTDLPLSWASRTNRTQDKTSPEELIAAAHSGCFAMAFSNTLSKSGHDPEQLSVEASCSFDQADGGFKISRIVLSVRGKVPGLSADEFSSLASEAGQSCPVSKALQGNVEISVSSQLE